MVSCYVYYWSLNLLSVFFVVYPCSIAPDVPLSVTYYCTVPSGNSAIIFLVVLRIYLISILNYLKEQKMTRWTFKVSLATATLVASTFGSTVYLESAKKSKAFASRKVKSITLNEAVEAADKLCEQVKNESGTPGLVVSVSIDGIPAYQKGWI